jgi:hypothetical protein
MINILVTASVDGPNNDDARVFLPISGFDLTRMETLT